MNRYRRSWKIYSELTQKVKVKGSNKLLWIMVLD
jgi:hypothetical protein